MSEWDGASLPANYKQAARAMAQLATFDECIVWKNKGRAMASYARQMNDPQLEKNAWEVKERAERRFGELSAGIEPAVNQHEVGGPSTGPTKTKGKQKAAEKHGVSSSQRKRAEQKAAMPTEDFEKHIEEGKKRIEKKHDPHPDEAKRQDSMQWWLKGVTTLAKLPRGGLQVTTAVMDAIDDVGAAHKNITKLLMMVKQRKPLR